MEAARDAAEEKIRDKNVSLQVQQTIESRTMALNETISGLEARLLKYVAYLVWKYSLTSGRATTSASKWEKESVETKKELERISEDLSKILFLETADNAYIVIQKLATNH